MNTVRFLLRTCQFAVLAVGAAAAVTTPVQIKQTVEPQFPPALIFSRILSGEARVLINVDKDGRLADVLVSGYTNKAFADEAVSLLKQWRYEAATEDGRPVGMRTEVRFVFSSQGRVVSLNAIDASNRFFDQVGMRSMMSNICQTDELDQPLAAVQAAVTRLQATRGSLPTGPASTIIIDFYVDERGQPRMPVVLNSPPTALTQAAVDALSQCRFNAPTRGGKPVVVRAQQKFVITQS